MSNNQNNNNNGNPNRQANRPTNGNSGGRNNGRRERNQTSTEKKGGAGGKILCLLLGFLMGVVGTIGGVGGLGYYAVSEIKIKDAIGTVNDLAGLKIDYTQYVNEQYGDSTVLGMIEQIIDVVGELQGENGCLNTLNNISPMVGTGVQALIDTVSSYGIPLDYETLMSTPFTGFADYLSDTTNKIEIAGLVETITQTPVEGLLATICYGELGVDYVREEDGSVKMLGNATPATIGTLTSADELNKRLTGISFYTLMSSFGGVNDSDPIIRALVHGEEGVDYILNQDGSVSPIPLTYALNTTASPTVFTAPDGTQFQADANSTWKDAAGNVIQTREDTSTYQFDLLDSKSNLVCTLKLLTAKDGIQHYQAYVSDVAQTRKGPYLSDVLGADADLMSIIGTLRLGDLLKLRGDSDPLMLAVAYGQKDVDYTVDANNVIHPINPPVTINDMISGGVGMDIVNDIPLSTVLNVSSPLQSGVDSLMIILAYGEEGTHYQLLDTNNDGTYDDWKWLTDEDGKPYTERTIGDLMSGDADSLFNSLTIETLMNVHAGSDDLMRALAYGNEGTHYVLVDGNPNDGITKKDVVQMLPKRYYLTGTKVYDEEHILIGSVDEETQSGIHTVHVIGDENAEYILPNPDGGYDVFPSLEAAQGYSADNDQRIYHGKTKLLDLRGEMAQICIERIELAAALNVDIFGTGENAPDPLMVQLAYGVEDVHYTLDRANQKIIWNKDKDPNSETYGLYFHARTIHDMKDTHSLLESIYLDTVLGLTYQSPAIMLSLAYGNNYVIDGETIKSPTRNTIGDLMGNNATALIEEIEMRKIITNVKSGDAMMNYILYNMTHPDESHPDYKVRTLGDFMNGSSAIIEGMMNTLTLKEALGEDATSSGILHGLRDTKLNQLGSEIEKLTLKEVLGDSISTHPILKNMQNSTLATIDDDLSSLTIQQMMDDGTSEGIYHYTTIGNENFRAVEVMVDGNPVWKAVLSTDTNGYRTWTFADGSGQAPSPLKGAWKYLLIDSTGKERLYTLEKMNSAMGNISTNMVKATLNDLNADGLITISSNDGTNVLTEKIIYSLNLMGTTHEVCSPYLNADGTQKQTLGELTVSETIEYISKMLAVVKPFS